MSEPKELFFLQVTDKNVNYRIGDNVSIPHLANLLTSFFLDIEKRIPPLASTIFSASAIAHFKDPKTVSEFRDHLDKVLKSFKVYPYPLAEQAKQQENANSNSEAPADH